MPINSKLFLILSLLFYGCQETTPENSQEGPLQTAIAEKVVLKVGDTAPDFELTDQHRERVRLSDFQGAKNVVLAFFPLAFTSGCRTELQRYQSDLSFFNENNTVVLAISVDAQPSQKTFAEELGAQYQFLSDWPDKEVSRRYGILSERGFAERHTFVIDKQGIIQRIDSGRDAIDITGAKSACSVLS